MCRSPIVHKGLCLVLSACIVSLPASRARAEDPPPGTEPSPTDNAVPTETAPPASIPEAAPSPGVILSPTLGEVRPAPRRTEVVYRRPNKDLLAAGLTLFMIGWVSDIGFTYGYDHQPEYTSLIPIAGPIIQMTQTYGLDGPPVDTGNAAADARVNQNLDTTNKTIRGLAITGEAFCALFQAGGLALTIAGSVMKRKLTRYAAAAPGGAVFRF